MRPAALAALALLTSACAGGAEEASPPAAPDDRYVVGVSNTVLGDDRREELICSVKAEALASGRVQEVLVDNVDGGPDRQAAGIRNLVASGADAIVVVPAHPTEIGAAIEEAAAAGAVVAAVDGPVASGQAYLALTDQAALGRVGMEWLAERLGGQGAVVLVRSEGDAARGRGAERVLAANPGLTVAAEVASPAEVAELVESGAAVDGVWAPGQDYLVVQALEAIGEATIPVVGIDNNEFLRQLRDGAPGAAVTNPAVVGAVGMTIALDVLDGLERPRRTLLPPEVWTWPEDRDAIQTSYDPSLPPGYSARVSVEPYTHFSSDQLRACQAP